MSTKNTKQALNEASEQVGEHVKKEKGDDFKEIADKSFKQDLSLKAVMGISDQKEEAVYGHAYLLYNTGRYLESSEIFRILITMNSLEPKYMLGLAACFHMLKDYDGAAGTYALAGFLDSTNPVPHFHLYDCYMQLGDKTAALLAIKTAMEKAKGKPEYKTLYDRCEISLQGLEQEVAKTEKKTGETTKK